MTKVRVILTVIALLVIVILGYMNSSLRDENKRLSNNQAALMEDVSFYKTESGRNAASVKMLQLTKDELKSNYDRICQVAKDLDIKIKRLQSASTTETKTDIRIETILKDTVIYRDTTLMRLQTFDWRDPWVSVKGNIYPDKKVDMDVTSHDTIYQVVHRVPKKFLWFRFGTKAIRQEVYSSNPHTTIIYTEHITLQR